MPLGTMVGLGPGNIVLDADPARLLHGAPRPIFGPCLLWPIGWMDQDATWYEGRPWPRPHCVTWDPAPPLPPKKRHSLPSVIFGPCLLWLNGRPSQPLFSTCYIYWRSSRKILECGPMPNMMVALPNTDGALCSTPQSLALAHCSSAVQ